MKKYLAISLAIAIVMPVYAAKKKQTETKDPFYVYQDRGSRLNHFIPSGWMGAWSALKLDEGSKDNPKSGPTCIKWTYTPGEDKQGAGWAGCFWQHPANNWGNKPGGFDLTGRTKFTFWARGEKGGETINEFKVGGITGEFQDTDSVSIGPITLTKKWEQYTIDLEGKDLTKIVGAFAWAASQEANQDGMVFYLDEMKFE